jgi:IS30 family transposase
MNKHQIASLLGRHHTTIGRELEKNSRYYDFWKAKYSPLEAHKKAKDRRIKANKGHIKLRKKHNLRSKIYSLLSDEKKCR